MYNLIKDTESLLSKNEILIDRNNKGVLTVYNEFKNQDAVYITAPNPIYIATDLASKEIAEYLEISVENISEQYPVDLFNRS